jgi:hypothetical protein
MRGIAALLVAAWAAAARAAAADAYAVLAVGEPPAAPTAGAAEAAERLRAALRERGEVAPGGAELRTRLVADGASPALAELERAYAAADRAFDDAQFEAAARALRALVSELDRHPDSREVHAQRVRALARVAYAEKVLRDGAAMTAALDRLVALDPGYAPDPVEYPPSYVKELEAARRRAAAAAKVPLTVTASGPQAVEVFVDGRPVGTAPVTVGLALGRHRVSGMAGAVRIAPSVVDLEREPRSVELDGALAGALAPDAGPGLVAAPAERAARVARAGAWLGATRAVAVATSSRGGEAFLHASLFDVERAVLVREGRVRMQGDSLGPAAAAALAAFVAAGQASPEVTPLPAKVDLSPSPPALAGELRAAPPRPRAWMRPASYGAAAAALSLAGLAAYEALSARSDFRAADGLLGADRLFASPADKAAYDHHRASGASEERIAYVGAASAAAFAVGAGVLGYLSRDERGAPVVRF